MLSQAELNAQINAAMETEDYDLCDKLNAQVEELSASKRNAEDILGGGGGGGGGGSDDLDAILSSGGSGAAVATGPSSERVPPCLRLRGRPPAGFDSIRFAVDSPALARALPVFGRSEPAKARRWPRCAVRACKAYDSVRV